MSQKSPVIERKAICPLCDSETQQYYVSDQSYIIGKYEEDQHPLEYQFFDKAFSEYHPNYYEIFYCEHCYYADLADDFLQGKEKSFVNKKSTMKRIHEIIEIKRKNKDETLNLLGGFLDINKNITFNESLNLHLLAIYVQELPEKEVKNHRKLAELYLKTAWLYRESRDITFKFLEDDIYDRFSNIFNEYFSEYKKFTSKFNYFRFHISKALDEESVDYHMKENYIDELYRLEILFKEANTINAKLMNLQEYGLGRFQIENHVINQEEPFKYFESMSEFMSRLQQFWLYMPNGEKICLEKACGSYEIELDKGTYYKKFIDKINIYKQIVILRKNLDQYPQALSSLKNFSEKLQEYKNLINNRIERLKKYGNNNELEELISQMHTLRIEETKIEKMKQSILSLSKKRELSAANDIAKKYKNKSIDYIKTKFIEAGITEDKANKFIRHIENNRKMIIKQEK